MGAPSGSPQMSDVHLYISTTRKWNTLSNLTY